MSVRNKGVEVGLLQFVDDTVFVYEESTHNILVIEANLRSFELLCGLKTKFCESKIGGPGLNMEVMDNFSRILYYRYMKAMFKYLGIPISRAEHIS